MWGKRNISRVKPLEVDWNPKSIGGMFCELTFDDDINYCILKY